MADLDLHRRPNGRYDFVLSGNDLAKTTQPFPAILRLLLQGSWVGDDGERVGQSLNDVNLVTSKTRDQVQRIVETRLAALLRSGQLTSVTVVSVDTSGDCVMAAVSVVIPGQQPQTIQVPITA